MAKIKFSISMQGKWIITHRNDDKLPSAKLKEYLQNKYEDDAKVECAGLSTVEVEYEGVRDEQTLSLDVIEFFEDHYDVTQNSGVYSMLFENLPEAEELPPFDVEKRKSEQAELDKTLEYIEELFKTDESDKSQKPNSKVLEKCEKLVGFKQFKQFAREIVSVACEIKRNQTLSSFRGQVYLFAINDGHGISTACELFGELLNETGLNNNVSCREFVLPAKRGENSDAFDKALSHITSPFSQSTGIMCVDISEWMNDIHDKQFRVFLHTLTQNLQRCTVIFRIPFVDKDVVENVASALNDLTFVKTVTFPPFTSEELRVLAKNSLQSFGFNMSSKAWAYFDERIALEKADGRFYGVKTVKKVVDELLYIKQLSDANRVNKEKTISANDAKKLLGGRGNGELTAQQLLDGMVGCKSIKTRISEIISQIELSRLDKQGNPPCIHMRFVGNPGTGKTTVARIIGKLLKEKGVLRIGSFFEYPGRYFCGRFIGETAPKTASICRDAYGSVLFIDEAYSLCRTGSSGADFGKEAIDTLIAEMENHRSDLLVIMAGYPDEMNTLMTANAGLESRMPYVIEFPNFTREELLEIFKSMSSKFKFEEQLFEVAKNYFESLSDETINAKEFSNARFVRNLFERTWAKASMRTQLEGGNTVCLKACDFCLAISDKEFNFNVKKKNRMGFI